MRYILQKFCNYLKGEYNNEPGKGVRLVSESNFLKTFLKIKHLKDIFMIFGWSVNIFNNKKKLFIFPHDTF